MNKRIIINNESSLSDLTAVKKVYRVIESGLISNGHNGKQYCFATVFADCEVFCKLSKSGTHTFFIQDKEA